MKKPLSEKEIDTIIISQVDDYSKWDEPICVKPRHALAMGEGDVNAVEGAKETLEILS